MLGKTHLLLAALFFLPLAYAFSSQGYFAPHQAMLFLLGVLLGALLPDADAPDSKVMHRQSLGLAGAYGRLAKSTAGSVFPVVGLVTRHLFYLPVASILSFTVHKEAAKHRGLMHSLTGVVLASAFWAIIFNVLGYLGVLPLSLTSLVLLGMVAGSLLHLYHDSLTPSGVNWLFPGKATFRGRIRTFGRGLGASTSFFDSQLYVIILFAVLAAAISWLAYFGNANPLFLSALSVFGLLLVALACGMESPEARGLVEWDAE